MRQKTFAILPFFLMATFGWCQQGTITTTVAAPGQTGLSAADFSVTVNGKVATVTAPPAAATAPAVKADDLTSVPPEAISSPTIFVFDVMETRVLDERDMRKIVLHYMEAASARKESVGLVLLTENGLKMVHDYRTGSAVLAAALDAVNGKGSTPVPGADRVLAEETRRLTDFARGGDANATPQSTNLRTNIEGPILMMRDIAAALQGVPGRKAIVWITNGVPFEILENDHSVTSHFESSSGPAVAGMRVSTTKRYMTDDQVKKMQPDWHAALDNLFESGTAVYPVEARGAFSAAPGGILTSTMEALAHMTGGRANYGSNDPAPFFASIATENANAYPISFAFDAGKGDWEKLAVSSSHSPKVIAAAGFFPPAQATPEETVKRVLGQGLNSPMSYSALPFNLTLGDQTASGPKKTVKFSVFFSPHAGVADMKAGEVSITIAAVALTANGAHAGSMSAAAGGKLPPEALQQISEMGVNLSKTIDLAPGDYTLRVVVRDNLTGRVGSVNAPLKVQ
jgi:VWFA-related protein